MKGYVSVETLKDENDALVIVIFINLSNVIEVVELVNEKD